jgi:hypothetical protein
MACPQFSFYKRLWNSEFHHEREGHEFHSCRYAIENEPALQRLRPFLVFSGTFSTVSKGVAISATGEKGLALHKRV